MREWPLLLLLKRHCCLSRRDDIIIWTSLILSRYFGAQCPSVTRSFCCFFVCQHTARDGITTPECEWRLFLIWRWFLVIALWRRLLISRKGLISKWKDCTFETPQKTIFRWISLLALIKTPEISDLLKRSLTKIENSGAYYKNCTCSQLNT